MKQSFAGHVLRVTLRGGYNSRSSVIVAQRSVAAVTALRSLSTVAYGNSGGSFSNSSSSSSCNDASTITKKQTVAASRPSLVVGGHARPKQTLASPSYSCNDGFNSKDSANNVKARPNLVGGGYKRSQTTTATIARNGQRTNGHNPNGVNGGHGHVNGVNGKRTNGVNGHVNGASVNGNRTKINGVNGHNKATTNGLLKNGFRINGTNGPSQKPREYESDLVVVLDMDECLIHSKFLSGTTAANKWAYQVARRQQAAQQQSEDDDDEFSIDSPPVVDSFHITLPDGDLVHVNKRPYLDQFLKELTSKYETHIFTAAMEIYAKPVIDTLDPHGNMFSGRWYRNSCAYHKNVGAYVKDLNIFENIIITNNNNNNKENNQNTINNMIQVNGNNSQDTTYSRIVLVDNNPLSFIANPSNGILVSNFYDDPTDKTLPSVLDLIHNLDTQEDVRPVLTEQFNLESSLRDILSANNRRKNDMNVA